MGKGYTKYDFVVDYYDRTGNYFARVESKKGVYIKENSRTGGLCVVMDIKDATIFRSMEDAKRAIERFSIPIKPFTRKPFNKD